MATMSGGGEGTCASVCACLSIACVSYGSGNNYCRCLFSFNLEFDVIYGI